MSRFTYVVRSHIKKEISFGRNYEFVFWKINFVLVSIYIFYCKFPAIIVCVEKHVLRSKNVLKCDNIICNSHQNITITPEMDSPYLKTLKRWCHSWMYYFWFSSYNSGVLRKAAILDLCNMAATAGIQLGSLKKLVCYGHIYT